MPRFTVEAYGYFRGHASIDVEAETEEEAIELAQAGETEDEWHLDWEFSAPPQYNIEFEAEQLTE